MTTQEAIEVLKANYPDAYYELLREAVDVAIEALGGNDVAQERKYTFGNDEFSLEAAYHDCKLVFDGITDDDSFQKADTGLILYYANEIVYALRKALEGNDANVLNNDCISRQTAIDAINGLIDRFERILRDIRESKVDESVCGMCEYDGAYMGQSGDWCNECPGFEKDDCFKLSENCKKRWLDSVNLPPAQPYTESEIQIMQDLEQAQLDKMYELGWKEGREALEKEIWEDGRDGVD